MAQSHNAKMAGITDELIQSILKFDPATNRQAYKHAKELASRGLRGYQYARTNQFDVNARFAGLDEKFRVKNRDDLADALQTRLQKLQGIANKFKPDILSLLLQLADRPLENTQVEALELLRPPSPPPPLTWDEILKEDPYSDEDIWRDVDYAVESSGDEQTTKKRGKIKTPPSTSIKELDTYDPESCVEPSKACLVEELEAVQFWNAVTDESATKIEITELQAIRETLFMLAGLHTSLYHTDEQRHNIRIDSRFTLSHTIPSTIDHLFGQFAIVGKDIYRLRQWTKKSSTLPLIQTFEAAARKRLFTYDQSLAQLQQRYLTATIPASISLLELHNEVELLSVGILRLAQLVSDIEPQLLVNPFSHLEALFDQITLAQMTLEENLFHYMSEIFFECLQTYLQPIRQWMELGELAIDDETFFVFANDSSSDAASLWHDRFVLRRDGQDKLRTPTFLQPAANKIFNTGKSVVFLKDLGIHNSTMYIPGNESTIDRKIICGSTTDIPISPFPELFQSAFETWIRSKYSVASAVLRQYVFESGDLMRTLIHFEILYLGKNGRIFEELANTIFERMDVGQKGWDDRYILTELARAVFGTVMPVSHVEKVVIRSIKVKSHGQSVKGVAGVSIDYALPWPIQNIVQRSSVPVYQQLFTFLLQTYRVKFLMKRIRPTRMQRVNRAQSQMTYKLQHRITWFVDTVRSYLTETVIFFTTRDMYMAMEKAEDIDEMSQIHSKYAVKLQERAMLSKDLRPIHKAVIELLDLGLLFAEAITSGTEDAPASTKRRNESEARKGNVSLHPVEELSDSDINKESGNGEAQTPRKHTVPTSSKDILQSIDKEFARLLPFVTVGLSSVARVGAEPMWEQLSERLQWEGKKERSH